MHPLVLVPSAPDAATLSPPCRTRVIAPVLAACLCAGSAFGHAGDPILAPRDYLGACGQMLFDPAGSDGDTFGGSIASDGQWLLIGARGDDSACPLVSACSSGAAHIYRRQADGGYVLWQTIAPADLGPYDRMGQSVALQGDTAFIQRGGEHLAGVYTVGQVEVYSLIDEQWEPTDTIFSGASRRATSFGFTIKVSGDFMALLSGYVDGDGRFLDNAIEIFRNIGGVWTYQDTVTDPLGRPRGQWTDDMALLEDGTLAVTDWQDATAFVLSGIVRIFEPVDGRWELTQELFAPDQRRYYGWSVDADAGRIAVGHISGVSGEGTSGVLGGRVDIYERESDRWSRTHAVTLADPLDGDGLGDKIALDGDRLMVVASDRPVREPFEHEGVWAVFDFDGSAWRQTLEAPGPPFGLYSDSIQIDVNGTTALLGHDRWTPRPGLEQAGSVFAYDLACLSCVADLDADGALTIFDFLTFLNLFEDGEAIADFDGDGELTIFDFLAFGAAFDAGCA